MTANFPRWYLEAQDSRELAAKSTNAVAEIDRVLKDLRRTHGAECKCGGTGRQTYEVNCSDTMDYSDWRSGIFPCNTENPHALIRGGTWEVSGESPACVAAWAAYCADPSKVALDKRRAEFKAEADRLTDHAAKLENDHSYIGRGSIVVVVKGRKVAHGTIGRVFWVGDNAYGTSAGMITTTGEKVFCSIENLKQADPDTERDTKLNEAAEADRAAYKAAKKDAPPAAKPAPARGYPSSRKFYRRYL